MEDWKRLCSTGCRECYEETRGQNADCSEGANSKWPGSRSRELSWEWQSQGLHTVCGSRPLIFLQFQRKAIVNKPARMAHLPLTVGVKYCLGWDDMFRSVGTDPSLPGAASSPATEQLPARLGLSTSLNCSFFICNVLSWEYLPHKEVLKVQWA